VNALRYKMLGSLTAGCLYDMNPAKFQLNSHPYFTGVMKQASYCCGEDSVCVCVCVCVWQRETSS